MAGNTQTPDGSSPDPWGDSNWLDYINRIQQESEDDYWGRVIQEANDQSRITNADWDATHDTNNYSPGDPAGSDLPGNAGDMSPPIPDITVTAPGSQSPAPFDVPAPNYSGLDTIIGNTPVDQTPPQTLLQILQGRVQKVTDVIKDPEKAFEFILKSTLGISKDHVTGQLKFDPFAAIGTAANVMTGGAAGAANAVGAIDGLAHLLGIKTPELNLTDKVTAPEPGDPSQQNAAGEFVPEDPYTTDAQGNTIPDTRQFTAVPQINADGSVDSIIVGKNDGSGVALLTPDDMKKYGIDLTNVGKYDFSSFFPSDGSTTPPDSQHGAPDVNGQYSDNPNYQGPDTSSTPPTAKAPNANDGTAPIVPDQNPRGGTGDVVGSAGPAPDPTPKSPTPPAVKDLLPSFQAFAMPEFKLLPNDFGQPMVKIAANKPEAGGAL